MVVIAGVAVLEGPMYAVGGHDGWSYLSTVERWEDVSHCLFLLFYSPISHICIFLHLISLSFFFVVVGGWVGDQPHIYFCGFYLFTLV